MQNTQHNTNIYTTKTNTLTINYQINQLLHLKPRKNLIILHYFINSNTSIYKLTTFLVRIRGVRCTHTYNNKSASIHNSAPLQYTHNSANVNSTLHKHNTIPTTYKQTRQQNEIDCCYSSPRLLSKQAKFYSVK